MNKQELVEIVASKTNVTKTKASTIVNTILSTIKDHLSTGGKVSLNNFGVFKSILRKSRTSRHPKTGKLINIQSKQIVKFKAGKLLKFTTNK